MYIYFLFNVCYEYNLKIISQCVRFHKAVIEDSQLCNTSESSLPLMLSLDITFKQATVYKQTTQNATDSGTDLALIRA